MDPEDAELVLECRAELRYQCEVNRSPQRRARKGELLRQQARCVGPPPPPPPPILGACNGEL